MTDQFLIAPSMLSSDFSNLSGELEKLKQAQSDWIHWDVMDGHFVPNLTFGAPVIKKARKASSLFYDVHLMIESPEKYISDFIDAGSDSVTIHIESTKKVDECFNELKSAGVKKGITLRPKTELQTILPYLSDVDLVLVMTVEPGFGGQSFMEDQIEKIKELKKLREKNNYHYKIEVDGGVSDKTAPLITDADVLVAGSYIFKSDDYSSSIERLKACKK